MNLTKLQRVIFSGILIVLAWISGYMEIYPETSNFFMILAAIIAGYPIAVNAITSARYKIIGIDALVTIAVIGAIIIGEYWEAAAVTFLFMFGSYLESRTLEKTRSSIKSLLDLAPKKAIVIRNGEEIELEANEVQVGDTVIIRPGDKIPVDGTVLEGNAYVNQASVTGESLAVNKANQDEVFSGTVVESGYLKITADKVGEDTTFSRILQMVEEAQDKKAKTQKFLEVFARYYTPGVIILAIFVFLITRDIKLTLTLLVIACPGALVIGTPVSIVAGIGNGAKKGVLVKGGETVEKLSSVDTVAFDKTGTLTLGKPMVSNVTAYEINEHELLRLAAGAEKYSEHPLGKAIIKEARTKLTDDETSTPKETEITAGQGITANIDSQQIYVGNRTFLEANNISFSEKVLEHIKTQELEGRTAVLIANDKKILGIISISDTIRDEAREIIQDLKKSGIKKIVMLTGDNQRTASAVAKNIGIDEVYSELLPENKVEILKKLQKSGKVAMVGDGINDAPALATADLGIAIGGTGTDVAMETADVVLMSNPLSRLSYAVDLSKATVRNMKQNIYFAILVAGSLLAGVLAEKIFLASGMLIHEISVLLVIFNAMRLIKFGNKKDKSKKTVSEKERFAYES